MTSELNDRRVVPGRRKRGTNSMRDDEEHLFKRWKLLFGQQNQLQGGLVGRTEVRNHRLRQHRIRHADCLSMRHNGGLDHCPLLGDDNDCE